MSTTTAVGFARRAAIPAALLVLPLAILALMRMQPAWPLDTNPAVAWSAPIGAAIVAAAGAAAVLVALAGALSDRGAAGYLNAAGKGVLAGTYLIEAIAGPASAGQVPSAASAVGGVIAALLLAAGAVLGLRATRITRGAIQVIGVVVLFVITELGLGIVALAMADGFRRPDEFILRLVGAGLLAITAVLVSLHARHALSPGLLAVGTLVLAFGRIGSADVLLGLATLAAGMGVFVFHHLRIRDADDDVANQDLPVSLDEELEREPATERRLIERMARELHGTINELVQARRTIELQRIELERAATVDELTGVASRGAILERLRFEAAEARRYDHPVAVLLLDIDGLAEINRQHGLVIGDAVLREVALRLRLRVREADAIGRTGDDAFLAILPHTDERGAAVFADTVRQRIGHREILTDAGALNPTVSIGVAIVRPGTDLDDEDVLANAIEALGSARAAGGDRIAFDRAHGLARLEEGRPPRDASNGA